LLITVLLTIDDDDDEIIDVGDDIVE